MKCPVKNNEHGIKCCLLGVLWFAVSALVLSVIIKLAAWVLSWFSSDVYLNTIIVMFSSIAMLIAFGKYCQSQCSNKGNGGDCCDAQTSQSNSENTDEVTG